MRLLFVAARELVLDTGHQVVVVRAPDGLLDHVQPPGGVQVHLHMEDKYCIYFPVKNVPFIFYQFLNNRRYKKFVCFFFLTLRFNSLIFCNTGCRFWYASATSESYLVM